VRRIGRILVRRPWLALLVPIVLITLLVAGSAPVTGAGPLTWVLVLFGLMAATVLAGLVLKLAGFDPEAEDLAARISSTDVGQALLARWIRRSRYYRYVGGAVGFVLGFGMVDNGDLVPLAVGILSGITVGGALAEVHAGRRGRSSTGSADLSGRRIADYVRRADVVVLGAVGCVATVVAVMGAVLPGADQGSAIWWAVAAVLTVGATGALLRLVTVRARPALSTELREADDLLRFLASTQGFTRPAMALSAVLLAQAINSLGADDGYSVAAAVLWLLGLFWYRSSRSDKNLRPALAGGTAR